MTVQMNQDERELFQNKISALADEIIKLPENLTIVANETGEFSGNKWAKVTCIDGIGGSFEVKVRGYSGENLQSYQMKKIPSEVLQKSLALKSGKNGAYIAGFDLIVQFDYLKAIK